MNFAVSAIGRDRPGIVAAISGVLLELGGNIDDSQMSILHGHFAVMLIVSVPEEVGREELAARLEAVRAELGLEGIAVSEIDELSPAASRPTSSPSTGPTTRGSSTRSRRRWPSSGVNITDLRTRRTGGRGAPVYVMVMEIAVPAEAGGVAAALDAVGERGRGRRQPARARAPRRSR